MFRIVLLVLVFAAESAFAQPAKNLILFLGDGLGLSTINAASIYGYGQPQALYLQSMPNLALSDTSSASSWVTESAAGMSAIVTGRKTANGVISQSDSVQRGVKDGETLKTILEWAEEKGLSTGVVTNHHGIWDATPAACYAHSNDRGKVGEIVLQILHPRYGDGVDVILGNGRARVLSATKEMGIDISAELERKGYVVGDSLAALEKADLKNGRVVGMWDGDEFDLPATVRFAIRLLSRNPKGFFLMVESDCHIPDARRTMRHTVEFDEIIRETAGKHRNDSLIVVTADHSYELRLLIDPKLARTVRGDALVPFLKIDTARSADGHTGEEVLVAAEGPGAGPVHGFMPNTRIFEIMLNAMGWK